MRYFAKYLPVEGNPKIGDWVDDPDLKEITQIHDNPEAAHPDTKVVQLFLCSRDIQVGDDVYLFKEEELLHMDGKYVTIEASDKLGVLDIKEDIVTIVVRKLHGTGKSGGRFGKGELFKVLGPISPNAIWVKEGDDILSKNVHRGTYKMGHKEWMVVDAEDYAEGWEKEPSVSIGGWTKCYLIEGSCGYFH